MTHLPTTQELLQIPKLLAQTLKQGTITLQTNHTQNIEITIQNNTLDLNFNQQQPLKTLLQIQTETQQTLTQKLKNLKTLAEELKQNNLTITISHKGQKLLTLGQKAKPTISQTLTETNAIEINNPIQLLNLLE